MKRIAIAVLATLFASGVARAATGTDWRARAAADLEAARAAIIAGHPGYIDEQNPAFRAWEAEGYEGARALLPRVDSYDSMLAAVRYYIAGFADGHLFYSDDARQADDALVLAGWRLDYVDGSYRVGAVMAGWGEPLPPVGAELVSCDGLQPEQRLRRIARYYDRRDLPGVRHPLATVFTQRDMAGDELKRCTFRGTEGKLVQLAQHYKQVKVAAFREMMKSRPRPQRFNGYTLQDGVLWIRAANFNPDREATQQLDRMLAELAGVEGVRTIVFDSRGNGGGNSGVGARIFDAATGGLVFDQDGLDGVPRSYAQWRVSDLSIRGVDSRIEKFTAAQGPDGVEVKWMTAVREALRQARAEGRPWIEQPGSPRLTRADIAARNGRLRRFGGNVVLLTDENCVSSCLNFADLVRSVPGAIHMGQATSADTAYIDVTWVDMPSGNHLMLPMKVWRNHLRGNNEALQPDVPLPVGDDAALRQAVLAALPR